MRTRILLAVIVGSAVVAACSDGGDEERTGSGPSPSTSTTRPVVAGVTQTTAAPTATVPPTTTVPAPSTSPFVHVEGAVTVPEGDPGAFSIVLIGPADSFSRAPVVIRNRTSRPLAGIEVTGIARDAAGSLIASGQSYEIAPWTVRPGEWGFGYVSFGGASVPADAKLDLDGTGREADDRFGKIDLPIAEVRRVQGRSGLGEIVGIVSNPDDVDVQGPISVDAICFTDGRPTYSTSGFTGAGSVPAGGTASFSLSLFDDPCPTFAVAASGWRR